MGWITRQEWGARYEDGAGPAPMPYQGIYVHHSATIAPDLLAPFDDDYAAVRRLEDIGESRFGRGISYTWAGTPVGLMFQGHTVNRLGAHTRLMNSRVRAVCWIGDYTNNPPTAALKNATADLALFEYRAGGSLSKTLLGGHRDVVATGCPGNKGYEAITEVNQIILGAPPAQPYILPGTPAHHTGDFLPYDFPLEAGHWFGPARYGSRDHNGTASDAERRQVMTLQDGLRKRGWSIAVDGHYGPATVQVVGKFQRLKGLAVDGLTGKATWTTIDRSPT